MNIDYEKDYDFTGIATAYNVKCSDGRTIQHGAFDHQSGTIVPLLWRHGHEDMQNVLGHGMLKTSSDPSGMRLYAKFNDTLEGIRAAQLVKHKDARFLSVWANALVEEGSLVRHGQIREVSLVLAGKNPGASIDNVLLHGDNPYAEDVELPDSAIIHSGISIEMRHAEDVETETSSDETSSDETLADILNTLNEKQREFLIVSLLIAAGLDVEEVKGTPGEGPSLWDIFETLNDKQKKVVHYALSKAAEQSVVQHSDDNLGENDMTVKNIFEDDDTPKRVTLSHDAMREIIHDAMSQKNNSLKEAFIAHAGTYGIDNISVLFPDAKYVDGAKPQFVVEPQEWVAEVVGAAKKSPFARIKSSYATITAEEARARGYITGAQKFEEVFPVFSRVTTPQTIYKKQKLDRDDIIDITEFDVVMWLREEMRIKMNEELARAVLLGDGRTVVDPDKINAANIRPILTDDPVYVTTVVFDIADTTLDLIDGVMESRKDYKGTGSPTFFTSTELLSTMMLVRDTTGRRIHDTEASLAASMRVKNIVEVPFMSNVIRVDGLENIKLQGILVNMKDYTIGADKGGQLSFFDDFDIDFNQYKYLLETRVSGALVNPKSAVVIEQVVA